MSERLQRALQLKAQHDAQTLDPAGQRELAQLLREDRACRGAIGADILTHRLLHLHAQAPDVQAVCLGVRRRREAEASASSFMRSLRPRIRHRRRRRPAKIRARPLAAWFGVAAAAAALLAIVLLCSPPAAPALWVVAAPQASADGQPLHPGSVLRTGQVIAVGASGGLDLAFADGSTVRLDPESRLLVQGLHPGKRLVLEHGGLRADVRPQAATHPLRIATPHAAVTVLGTRFSLEVDARTLLRVESGRVRIDGHQGGSRLVGAGEQCQVPVPAASLWDEALARYDFSAGSGDRIADRSSSGLDLHILDPTAVRWLPGGGLRIERPTRIRSLRPARELIQACRASDALTVLVEITPVPSAPDADPFDQPKRILCLPEDLDDRNLSLGQGLYGGASDVFDMRIRSSEGTRRGRPSVATAEAQVAARRMWVGFTRDAEGRCSFLIDGRPVPVVTVGEDNLPSAAAAQALTPGSLDPWGSDLHLTLAAEAERDQHGSRAWTGTFHAAAIFPRALSPEEIASLCSEAAD